jgi:hypothetical protein
MRGKGVTRETAGESGERGLGSTSMGPMYFVFCRLYPSSPQPLRQCLGPSCQLLLTNTVDFIAGAGLPIHMMV